MRITRTIVYAVQATTTLAKMQSDRPVPCSELAKIGKMPQRFLLQILHCLVTRGILESAPGASGGYYLARPASTITLLDIVEAFDFPLQPAVPEMKGLSLPMRQQLMASATKISAATRRELQRVTIADLVICADPPGRPSGGVAPLNHRLIARNPPDSRKRAHLPPPLPSRRDAGH